MPRYRHGSEGHICTVQRSHRAWVGEEEGRFVVARASIVVVYRTQNLQQEQAATPEAHVQYSIYSVHTMYSGNPNQMPPRNHVKVGMNGNMNKPCKPKPYNEERRNEIVMKNVHTISKKAGETSLYMSSRKARIIYVTVI
jgi:hypothetical protein